MHHEPPVNGYQQRFARRALVRSAIGIAGIISTGPLAGCGSIGGASDSGGFVVEMNDEMIFDPDPVTITVGTQVTFTNVSTGFVHTATCDPALDTGDALILLPDSAEPWDSGNVQPGASWAWRFETPGEYRYVCVPHVMAGMIGTIVVEQTGA
jgi:plastocyanin